jgi:hypothetical protein
LTDPNVPAINKTDIVTPGFTSEEAGTVDDHLNQMNARGERLPPHRNNRARRLLAPRHGAQAVAI